MGWNNSWESLTKVTFEQRPEVGDKGQAFLVTRGRLHIAERTRHRHGHVGGR